MAFVPSQAQQDIFDFCQFGKGSATITAVAGAGKTTTVVKALDIIPAKKPNGKDTSILMLAFNKSIATELQERVPAHVKASTFHSLGLGALAKHFGKGIFKRIDDKKIDKLCGGNLDQVQYQMYRGFVCKLVDLAKQQGVGILEEDTDAVWCQMVSHYDVDQELEDEQATIKDGIKHARMILNLSNTLAEQMIDFADMIYLPLLLGLRLWGNDWVFVDEAQDLNPTRRALARKALAPGGRLIAVGDPSQAVYGFTGASHDSMEQIKRDFNAIELPLTVSYRCPQAVVKAAQQYVPYIQAHPDAPVGVVRDAVPGKERFLNSDTIICRNTAPLVSLAYRLLGQGIGCRILGREIGKGLVNLIKKMKAKSIQQLIERLEAWQVRETELAVAKGQEQKAQGIEDRAQAIMAVIEQLPETEYTVTALIKSLEGMFDDTKKGILTLSTIHKAKGLEYKRVFILEPHLMPSKWARQKWQQVQENNLIYVAYTRAQEELIFLPMPDDLSKFLSK